MDKCKTRFGYNVVPPPYTGNFMPPKSDFVYPSLDDFVDMNESVGKSVVEKPTVETNEPKTTRKENGAPIIEDWVSDSDEENMPKVKTVNGEVQLQALVDGKKVIITETSLRKDLQLEDAEGIACLPNADIFEQLTLMGSGRNRKSKRKDIEIPQSSGPTEPIADEAANEENVPTHSNDPLLSEKKGGSRTQKLKRQFKVGRFAQVVSSEDEGLGDQEDASKQGSKIDDINHDAKVTLVDETHGRYDDAQMFDTDIFNGEEVFVAKQSEKVVEEVVSTAKVSAAAKHLNFISFEIEMTSSEPAHNLCY
ncbi:hypothetical protein Tco_0642759 [Tanacetum coccineum]